MRNFVFSFGLIFWALGAQAFEIEDNQRFGSEVAEQELRILSTADIRFFQPVIAAFLEANPEAAIDYTVASSSDVLAAVQSGEARFDLAISSAMDLQTKLANDGWAKQHVSATTENLPEWAVWNDMLFAFTQEPAAIVVSRKAFEGSAVPQGRHDLINLLRQDPERFRGRIGTYDVRQSGLGYLFATQDTRASETYWRLTEVFGSLGARLYCCSSDMIDAVKSGELLIAYNVLGSYAVAREDSDEFAIVLPSDFTTVMLRTAMIPQNAESPEMAGRFIDHMLARAHGRGGALLTDPVLGMDDAATALNRIRIGPGLLVFLDQLKRQAFLSEWESAILQK
ncbi:iron(III) transport system substrate-binding protein [Shimia isoporae]|uniref:Iron(III) transport system substrate-binding protein n=1 Tax=Shimia isoporae TaxID=647720 RepID=A0A4R1NPV3_9RHOB|nr:ABC transporter substrate-binding protein [Shimia isoporae]TCL09889.1 iron(III) transport system substrate-binding protein [Shimia isoporae]